MSATTPSEHYAEDGHPLNVPRTARFHTEEGLTICGECACRHAQKIMGGWNTNQSAARLNAAGYERDPMTAHEDPDWCSDCDVDFTI